MHEAAQNAGKMCIHWPLTCNLQTWLVLLLFCTKEGSQDGKPLLLLFHNYHVFEHCVGLCSTHNFIWSSLLPDEVRFTDGKTEFRVLGTLPTQLIWGWARVWTCGSLMSKHKLFASTVYYVTVNSAFTMNSFVVPLLQVLHYLHSTTQTCLTTDSQRRL